MAFQKSGPSWNHDNDSDLLQCKFRAVTGPRDGGIWLAFQAEHESRAFWSISKRNHPRKMKCIAARNAVNYAGIERIASCSKTV